MASRRSKQKAGRKTERRLNTATAAGAKYAEDQLAGDYFHDWVWDQMFEGEQMRRETPDAVLPLKSKHDYDAVARNILQMLSHDIDRGLDHSEVVELAGGDDEETVNAFWDGLHHALEKRETVSWLSDELLVPMQAEIDAKGPPAVPPEQLPLPRVHARERGGRRRRLNPQPLPPEARERAGIIDWDDGPASQGQWFGRVGGQDAYVITTNTSDEARRATGLSWGGYALARVTRGGDRHIGYFRTRGIAQSQASSDLVASRTQGAAPQTWAESRRRPIRRGPRRPVREDPRDYGYDPQSKAGPKNFPKLRRHPPLRRRRRP